MPISHRTPSVGLVIAFLLPLLNTLHTVGQADASEVQEFDVVIYGGTSAAVTAAVEASRNGKSVVIVSPDPHLGGLTSNGLGWTDIGDKDAIGGLSREFYHRVYKHYLNPESWTTETRQEYKKRSSLDPDDDLQVMFTFEPKVARQIFEKMVGETSVKVVSGKLNRESGVVIDRCKIQSIQTLAGNVYAGNAFIDATYEGDLMAAAGVPYMLGREANSEYNETLNGIQTSRAVKNQLPDGIDPFVVPGEPNSGLLPGVNANSGGADGSQDNRLQAYNFRMALTNNPSNRVPVPKPDTYDVSDYEILFRAIEAGQSNGFFKLDAMPNSKTDSNNHGGISTDFIGANYNLEKDWNYAEADYESREDMLRAHADYQIGLVWTLQNHPRVPASIQNTWKKWGLPKDEFTDNGNWPCQVYVREARRMIGSVVITERHVNQEVGFQFTDSVGMGGYNMDSHNVQRYIGPEGTVKNEGDIQAAPARGPYPISYQAMIPRTGEVENLLVPVAISSTHIAYGSIRMEPVFMVLGQSAGAAAGILCDHQLSTYDIPYSMLRARLLRGNQVLEHALAPHDTNNSGNSTGKK